MNIDGLYAATQDTPAPALQQFTGIPAHPGEDGAAKQEDDWWRVFNSVLSNSDAMHFIADETPPRLAALEAADLSDYSAVAVPPVTDSNVHSRTSARLSNTTDVSRPPLRRTCAVRLSSRTTKNARRKRSLRHWIRLCGPRRLPCSLGSSASTATMLNHSRWAVMFTMATAW